MKEKFYIGVDAGGSGTRVLVADQNLTIISSAKDPPSALGQGIEKAWKAILETIALAFTNVNANGRNESCTCTQSVSVYKG